MQPYIQANGDPALYQHCSCVLCKVCDLYVVVRARTDTSSSPSRCYTQSSDAIHQDLGQIKTRIRKPSPAKIPLPFSASNSLIPYFVTPRNIPWIHVSLWSLVCWATEQLLHYSRFFICLFIGLFILCAPFIRVCSICETQWRHSVKKRLYKTPPPYFIVLASSVKTNEVKVIEFHRINNSKSATSSLSDWVTDWLWLTD